MSSCPTAPTSTTVSLRSCRSPADSPASPAELPPVVIACGALGGHLREILARRGWRAELHCLPALLHNRPKKITIEAERLAVAALARGQRVAVAYADCSTYSALDEVCGRLGLRRLPGLHCYDVLAGPGRMRAVFEAEPGTYVLTDFLVRSFDRTVLAELGLDRHPELWPDYFGHYRRVVWLAQEWEPGLAAQAEQVAARFGLPLTVVPTGTARLERELESLVAGDGMWSWALHPQKNVGGVPTTTNDAGQRSGPSAGGRGGPDAGGRGGPDAGGRGEPGSG